MEGESGLSLPEGAEAYKDSSAVAKDVVDIIELARDSGRITVGVVVILKDEGGGDDNVVGGEGAAASCEDAGGAWTGEGSALTTGLGIVVLGASFTGDAKGSSTSVSTF